MNDLLGGQVQVMFDSMPSIIQHIARPHLARAGRDLGDTVFSNYRIRRPSAFLVPGSEASALFGMASP